MPFVGDGLPPRHGMAVVMVGNLSEGYRAVGPFKTMEEAYEWADKPGHNGLIDTWVVPLEAQDKFKFKRKNEQ